MLINGLRKNHMKILCFALATTLLLMSTSIAIGKTYPITTPSITWDNHSYGDPNTPARNEITEPILLYSLFYRNLGKNSTTLLAPFIRDYTNQKHLLKIKQKKLKRDKNLQLIKVHVKHSDKGMYLLQQDSTIGYCLFIDAPLDPVPNLLIVQQIHSVPQNPNYLKQRLKVPANASLTVYEKNVGDFVERYITLKYLLGSRYAESLILDAFYPQDLEPLFQKKIVSVLNKFMKNRIPNPQASNLLSQTDDDDDDFDNDDEED